MNKDDAEALAVSALTFVSSDSLLLQRFLSITGISATDIRRAAAEPGFLAGVLQFVAAHEPTLLEFAAATEIRPEAVGEALRLLPSGDEQYEPTT